MNITFACPECEQTSRQPIQADQALACSACGWRQTFAPEPLTAGKLERCLVCGCGELFVRKNFSQRLGVAIVVVAAISSAVAWGFHMWYTTYAILFGAALLDLALYVLVGNLLQCYRCHAEYRGLAGLDQHVPFNLETHERYRQQKIRLRDSQASQSREA